MAEIIKKLGVFRKKQLKNIIIFHSNDLILNHCFHSGIERFEKLFLYIDKYRDKSFFNPIIRKKFDA